MRSIADELEIVRQSLSFASSVVDDAASSKKEVTQFNDELIKGSQALRRIEYKLGIRRNKP
jgi:hypothetical protein